MELNDPAYVKMSSLDKSIESNISNNTPTLNIQRSRDANQDFLKESFSEETRKNITHYKRSLLLTIISAMFLLALIIAERIANKYLTDSEVKLLISFQSCQYLGIDLANTKNYFYYLLGLIGEFHIFFLIETHILITIYVAIDSFLALKTMFLQILGCYVFSILSTFYSSPRPYWVDSEIRTYFCEQTFSTPGELFFSVFFLLFYLYKSFKDLEEEVVLTVSEKESFDSTSLEPIDNRKNIRILRGFLVFFLMISILVFFFRYAQGLCFLHGYVIGMVYFVILFGFVMFFEKYLQELIKKTTILKEYSKQQIFYWFVTLIIAETFAILVYIFYDNNNIKMKWIENFVRKKLLLKTYNFFS